MKILSKADRKFKSGSTREYQFVEASGDVTLVVLEKSKSGYAAEIRGVGLFKHTDGLRTIKDVQKWLNSLKKSAVDNFDIEENTLRVETSRRGGGVEISLDALGAKYRGHRMNAYQNYLGGGMLGSIQNDCTYNGPKWREDAKLVQLAERLARYFHALTNEDVEDYDEWAAADFETVQQRSSSAY